MVLLLTLNANFAAISPSDQKVFASLRSAVIRVEDDGSLQKFARSAPRSNTGAWQRLQRGLPATGRGYGDLAFALAYYGVDYERNIRRLLASYRRWRRRAAGPREVVESPRAAMHDDTMLESLPVDLGILYRERRDDLSLGTLLDLRLDGYYAETQEGVVEQLWPAHRAAILRTAAGFPRRVEVIAVMFRILGDSG